VVGWESQKAIESAEMEQIYLAAYPPKICGIAVPVVKEYVYLPRRVVVSNWGFEF